MKTTCCFEENDVLFSVKGRERENTHPQNKNREQRIRIVKISITSLSRAHAHTRIPGVFAFLLSQVSQNNRQRTITQSITAYFQTYFNKHEFQRLKIGRKHDQKSFFSLFRPPKFARFFPPDFSLVWHLWQQKINIAVGRRARTRVRETEKHEEASFWQLHHTKQRLRKIFCHFFLDFSLFGGISTHIPIGRETKSKGRKKFIRHLEWWRGKSENCRTFCIFELPPTNVQLWTAVFYIKPGDCINTIACVRIAPSLQMSDEPNLKPLIK